MVSSLGGTVLKTRLANECNFQGSGYVARPLAIHIGGPAGSTNDVSWTKCGSYFLTCNDDMTTRIYAQTVDVI